MSIEIAYLAERTLEVVKALVNRFFPQALAVKQDEEEADSAGKKRFLPPGTRILSASPSLGRNEDLQMAIRKMKDILDMTRTFGEEKDRALGSTFVNMFRSFLMAVASVSEAGAARNRPMMTAFLDCLRCCSGLAAPPEVKGEAKRSWSNFLQAVDKKTESVSCTGSQTRLTGLLQAASSALPAEPLSRKPDTENLIAAAENLLEACKNCVFRKDMRK